MATNGKSNGHERNAADYVPAVVVTGQNPVPDPVLEMDDAQIEREELAILPIKPLPEFLYERDTKAYRFFTTTHGLWEDWWFEFTTSLDKDGNLLYFNTKQFVEKIEKRKEQRAWLKQMIGHEPMPLETEKGVIYEVPYLGDWTKIRKQNQKVLSRTQAQFLRKQFQVQVETLRKAQATSIITVRDIARMSELQDQIDQAFAGMVFDQKKSPTHPDNRRRLNLYMNWQRRALQLKNEALNAYYRSLGLSTQENWTFIDNRRQLSTGDINTQVTAQSAQILPVVDETIQAQTARALQEGQVSIDDLLLAKMLRAKSKTYNMKLPNDIQGLVDDTTDEDLQTAKKRKGVH